MTTSSQAIAKAMSVTRWAVGMCDSFVAQMYGFSGSGYNTAVDNWKATPPNLKHPNDMQAPEGALMYWGGGDGHVAISLGDGTIRSTDIGGFGTVTTAPASAITQKWGKPYLGWAYPYFSGTEATNSLGGWNGSTSVVNASLPGDILGSIDPGNLASGFVGAFTKPFEALLSSALWGFETLLGIVLMLIGVRILFIKVG